MPDSGDLADLLAQRPLLIVLAGPNGAGKSTFFHAHLAALGLRFVNADILAKELTLDADQAAAAATALRSELIRQRETFITETVFSDPVGDKLAVFTNAMQQGYTVVMLFIGVSSPERCDERVAMRVSQGGHDVPPDRLISRFPRVLANLYAASQVLSMVRVYDNDDLSHPFRLVAQTVHGRIIFKHPESPDWWHDRS